MITLVSKGNGRNYYGYEEGKETPIEIVREGGRFYVAKYHKKFGLTAMGNPIKKYLLSN